MIGTDGGGRGFGVIPLFWMALAAALVALSDWAIRRLVADGRAPIREPGNSGSDASSRSVLPVYSRGGCSMSPAC